MFAFSFNTVLACASRDSSSNAMVLSERTAQRCASCYSALRLSRLDFCLLLRVNIGWDQTTSLGLIHCVPELDCTAITACCTSISSKRPRPVPVPAAVPVSVSVPSVHLKSFIFERYGITAITILIYVKCRVKIRIRNLVVNTINDNT